MKFASRGFNSWAGTERRLGLAEVLAVCFLLNDSRSVLSKTKQPPRYRKKSVTRGPGAAAAGAVTCTALARGAGSVLAVSWALLGSKIPYRENGANPEGASGDAATEIASVGLGNSLASAGCVCAQPAGLSPLPTNAPRVLLFHLDNGISLSKRVPGAEGSPFSPPGGCAGARCRREAGRLPLRARSQQPAASPRAGEQRADLVSFPAPVCCTLQPRRHNAARHSAGTMSPCVRGSRRGGDTGWMPWGSAPLARGLPM